MALTQPNSIEECIYFTRRDIDSGNIMVWVFRKQCPQCNKELMGKPKDKNGKALIRAKEYVCLSCAYMEPKEEYESSLTANVVYTCPKCSFNGEAQIPFKRRNIGGIATLRFTCEKCNSFIDVTKKMKERGSKEDDSI